ncbi:MAG: VCBS repeat-containing protein [Flavobacteriaceae bacterium]|nr:VCBS repeat-containing protein [Flavobacteriaceae bacterium]
MKKLLSLFAIFLIVLSCSSDETSTPVTPQPAPIAKYTITISAGDGGSVSTTGGEYESGQTVNVTATPQGEYLFKDWSDGNTNATRTITISSNSSLTANFEKKKYPLTVNIEGEGEVLEEIVNAGRTTDYDSGTTVKLTAVPAEGWIFSGWTGSIESNELEIQLLVSKSETVKATFKYKTRFISKSERYSLINESTGYFNNQNNFYKYTTDSIARNLEYYGNDCNNYWFSTSDQITYDFNNDGFLDSVSFQYNSEYCELNRYGYLPGIISIQDDFFNGGPIQYYEIDLRWVAGDWELNDINGDGDFEVIVYSFNRHENLNFPVKDVTILDIDSNLNLQQRQLDYTGYDFHNGSSGDVDNDGDIDLIKWKVGNGNQNPNQDFPKILINNGLGDFTEEPLLENQTELESQFSWGWGCTLYDLFDFNDDGYLDIVTGYNFGNFETIPNQDVSDFYGKIVILWGSESGRFNSNNITIIEDSNYLNVNQIFLGTSFTDYDKDGDIDLITTSTDNYTNYIINIFQNNGDKTFTDVTQRDCDQCYNNNLEDFSHFYRFYSIDKDNDGDFDLVPGDVNSWAWDSVNNKYLEFLDNLYWENIGGKYIIRKEN